MTKTVTMQASPNEVRLAIPRSATLAGVVRDRRGVRIAGARVFVDDLSTTTDANGNFRLNDAPSGSYWIEAELDGVRGGVQVRLDPGAERQAIEIELPQ